MSSRSDSWQQKTETLWPRYPGFAGYSGASSASAPIAPPAKPGGKGEVIPGAGNRTDSRRSRYFAMVRSLSAHGRYTNGSNVRCQLRPIRWNRGAAADAIRTRANLAAFGASVRRELPHHACCQHAIEPHLVAGTSNRMQMCISSSGRSRQAARTRGSTMKHGKVNSWNDRVGAQVCLSCATHHR